MQGEPEAKFGFQEIVGEHPALKRLIRQAREVAESGTTALITGENGAGKELIARAIHRMGNRRRHSFVKIDCSRPSQLEEALFGQGRGRLEAANLGTLLLKSIEDVSQELRTELLRVFEQRAVGSPGDAATVVIDTRLIATMSDSRGEDSWLYKALYPRHGLSIIRVPTLRERQSDIPQLAWYFARMWATRMNKSIDTISPEAMESFVNYGWPNNVKELEYVMERCVRSTEGSELRSVLLRPPQPDSAAS